MNKLTIKNALTNVGITDEKQADFFAAFEGKSLAEIGEKDVAEVLEKLGVSGEQALNDFLAAVREPQIMEQELDLDELEAVAGGDSCDDDDSDLSHCTQQYFRCLDTEGCAATVEIKKGKINSTCSLNDGCSDNAVIYRNPQKMRYARITIL